MVWTVLGVDIVVCLMWAVYRVIGFAMGFVVLMGVCVSLRKWLVDFGGVLVASLFPFFLICTREKLQFINVRPTSVYGNLPWILLKISVDYW